MLFGDFSGRRGSGITLERASYRYFRLVLEAGSWLEDSIVCSGGGALFLFVYIRSLFIGRTDSEVGSRVSGSGYLVGRIIFGSGRRVGLFSIV